jgi:Ankyrin repeats (3 copies)
VLELVLTVGLVLGAEPRPAPAPPTEPVLRAAWAGELAALDAELARDGAVRTKDEREWTALHWAAIGGQTAAVERLLARGADPDARGQYDMAPLHWAALLGHDEVVRALAARGARLEARTLYGMTALHLAGTEAVVASLAEAGARLEQRDNAGLSPLFTVRSKEAGQALLGRGADLHARARDGRTLFDMLVVNTLEPHGLVLYGRRSGGRLRGERTRLELQLFNVSATPLAALAVSAQSQAATATAPEPLAKLAPGQLATVAFELVRRPEVPEGMYPLVATVSAGGRALGTFEIELDTNRTESPADQGFVRLGEARLKRTPSRAWEALLLVVPLLVVAVWLAARKRSGATRG